MARTVKDVALLLEVVAGPDPLDPSTVSRPVPAHTETVTASPAGLRVGIPDRYFTEGVDSAVATAYQEALKVLKALKTHLVAVRLPQSFEPGVEAGRLIMHVEGTAFHLDWFRTRPQDYGSKLRALIEAGMMIPGVSYLRAQQVRKTAIQAMVGLFEEIDLLTTPATPTSAPHGLAWTGDPVFNAPFSTFGLPALVVPMGWTPADLPIGLQLVGRPFDEETILRVGAAYETATGWWKRTPPLEQTTLLTRRT
jgi:aspartyl-tRNA(Asn)/glutamyl-tRNA(Gln) amidotransferase subunit A